MSVFNCVSLFWSRSTYLARAFRFQNCICRFFFEIELSISGWETAIKTSSDGCKFQNCKKPLIVCSTANSTGPRPWFCAWRQWGPNSFKIMFENGENSVVWGPNAFFAPSIRPWLEMFTYACQGICICQCSWRCMTPQLVHRPDKRLSIGIPR